MSAGRAIGRGLLGALLAPLLWILVAAAPGLWVIVGGQLASGSGGAGIVVDSNHLLIAAVVGLVVGAWSAPRRR